MTTYNPTLNLIHFHTFEVTDGTNHIHFTWSGHTMVNAYLVVDGVSTEIAPFSYFSPPKINQVEDACLDYFLDYIREPW